MRKSIIIALTIVLVTAAFKTADVLQQLKLSRQEAEGFVEKTVEYGHLSYPSSARFLPVESRLEVTRDIIEFARVYTNSAAFKAVYAQWWKEQEPPKPLTVDERLKRAEKEDGRVGEQGNEAVNNLREQIKQTTDPQMKKSLQEALDAYLETQQQMQTPEMKQMMTNAAVMQKKQFEEDYKTENEKYKILYEQWQAKKDSKVIIRQLLKNYLATVKTVDFNAATMQNSYGKKVFVNPEYQAKPADWKLCFRAGKQVNEAARPLVEQWLHELE